MKILNADFVTSAPASGAGVPDDGLPHVALVGRSNVGKSSLLNALTRRRLARTSAAPGKTRLINVYRVDLAGAAGPGRTALYLVDLPGYGYARGDSGDELRAVAEAYLVGARGAAPGVRTLPGFPAAADAGPRTSNGVRRPPAALLLIDSRHPGLESDVQAARWLDSLGVGYRLVATKVDKLTRSERARNLTAIGDTFGKAVLPVSAASGEGMEELWRTIVRIARDVDRDA